VLGERWLDRRWRQGWAIERTERGMGLPSMLSLGLVMMGRQMVSAARSWVRGSCVEGGRYIWLHQGCPGCNSMSRRGGASSSSSSDSDAVALAAGDTTADLEDC
jgi:hypothetical protein